MTFFGILLIGTIILAGMVVLGLIVAGVVVAIKKGSGGSILTALGTGLAIMGLLLLGMFSLRVTRETQQAVVIERGIEKTNVIPEPSVSSAPIDKSQATTTPTEAATPEKAASSEEGNAPPRAVVPEWTKKPAYEVKEGSHYFRIHVGPYATRRECDEALRKDMRNAVMDLIAREEKQYRGWNARDTEGFFFPNDAAMKSMIRNQFVEKKPAPEFHYSPNNSKEWIVLHSELQITSQQYQEIRRQWNTQVRGRLVAQRTMTGGIAGGFLLSTLAILFGYLKLDALSGGHYRGRLKFAAVTCFMACGFFFAVFLTKAGF